MSHFLNENGGSTAAAVAEAGDAELPGLERVNQVVRDPGAGHSERVADANRSSVDVHLRLKEIETRLVKPSEGYFFWFG